MADGENGTEVPDRRDKACERWRGLGAEGIMRIVLSRRGGVLLVIGWMAAHGTLLAQGVTATGRVTLVPAAGQGRATDNSNAVGEFAIANVPSGRYALNVWHERCLAENLRALSRQVAVSPAASSLGELRLLESGNLLSKHKNKYGRDYDLAPRQARPTINLEPIGQRAQEWT